MAKNKCTTKSLYKSSTWSDLSALSTWRNLTLVFSIALLPSPWPHPGRRAGVEGNTKEKGKSKKEPRTTKEDEFGEAKPIQKVKRKV